jgi:cytochrome c oxidase subunit 2
VNEIALHPASASTAAPGFDLLFLCLLVFSAVVGLILFGMILVWGVKYRRGSIADRSGAESENNPLEFAAIGALFVVAFGLFGWGAWLFLTRDHVPPDAIHIAGTARQWMWQFEHDNGEKELNTLHVPVDEPVVVDLVSEDVIHSMFVPAFRIKQDAVPGLTTRLWFEATRTGSFDLFCAQYCGTQHSEMRGQIVVMSEADFSKWLSSSPTDKSLVQQGAELFRSLGCSGCHDNSPTVRAPDLHGVYGHPVALANRTTVIADDQYLRDSILQPEKQIAAGYEPIMPSFDGLIAPDDLEKLVAYLKSLSPRDLPRDLPKDSPRDLPGGPP